MSYQPLSSVLAFALSRPIRLRVERCLRILLIVIFCTGIAYSLIVTARYLLAIPVGAIELASERNPLTLSEGGRLKRILAANLFGPARSTAPVISAVQVQSDRRLRLQGTFEASDGTSVAIVSEEDRPPERYRVGQELPGLARLSEVGSGRVLIERSGQQQALVFETKSAASASRSPRFEANGTRSIDDAAPETVAAPEGPVEAINLADEKSFAESYIRRIVANPAAEIAEFGLQEIRPGQADGYRVAQTTPYFDRVAFKVGDVILAVNGTPVGRPELDHLELANLIAVGSTDVTVRRDGELLNLISFNDPLEAQRMKRGAYERNKTGE